MIPGESLTKCKPIYQKKNKKQEKQKKLRRPFGRHCKSSTLHYAYFKIIHLFTILNFSLVL